MQSNRFQMVLQSSGSASVKKDAVLCDHHLRMRITSEPSLGDQLQSAHHPPTHTHTRTCTHITHLPPPLPVSRHPSRRSRGVAQMQLVPSWGPEEAKGWFSSVKKPARETRCKPLGSVRVRITFLGAFPYQAEPEAGWPLVGLQEIQRDTWARPFSMGGGIRLHSPGHTCQVSDAGRGLPQGDLLHTRGPPGLPWWLAASWVPFLHF